MADAADPFAMFNRVVPGPAASAPPATALDGDIGSRPEYARADHTHAARIQRIAMTTAADGTISWVFARPIDCPAGKVPPIAYMVEDSGTPVIVAITGRAMTTSQDGLTDTHTAVSLKAMRSQSILGLGGIVLLTTLIPALTSYNPFGGTVTGVKVNLFAAPPTQ